MATTIKEIVLVKGTNGGGYITRDQDPKSGETNLNIFPNFGSAVKAVRTFFDENRDKDKEAEVAAPRAASVE